MHSSFYGYSSISETLDIVERGLRRLGISGHSSGPVVVSGLQAEYKRARHITPDDVVVMRQLTVDGLTQAEIARRIGCTQGAVSKALTRIGISSRRGRKQRA